MSLFFATVFGFMAIFAKQIAELFKKQYKLTHTAIPTALTTVFVLTAMVNVVSPGTNQVQTLFGNVKPQPLEAGVHLVNPLADFTTYDLRQQTETFDNIGLQTQDRLTSDIDLSVTVSALPSYTPSMFTESGTLPQAIDKHLIPTIRSIVREVGRSVPQAQALVNADTQNRIQDEIESKLNEYLSTKGFTVHAVMIRDIELPAVVKQAVVATKEREEQIEREKAQLKIIEQQAQQQVVQAEAKANAATQQAIAIETLAKAEAFRILTEAQATAEGNTLVNKSLTKDLINYTEANRWDGKLPQTVLSNSTVPLLQVK